MATTTEVHGVLVKARARIADPERWTKGADARDALGRAVDPTDYRARQWCALGAVQTERPGMWIQVCRVLHIAAGGWVSDFNDAWATSHADVLALFDRAIEATKP